MKKTTKEWVGKAEDDWLALRRLARGKPPLHDQVCFHGQQCAEKYLKALLVELGLSVPKTHDLYHLFSLLKAHYPSLRSLRRGFSFLTDQAVEVRYPGKHARKRQAVASRRWAQRVRQSARLLLGLRQPRKKSR